MEEEPILKKKVQTEEVKQEEVKQEVDNEFSDVKEGVGRKIISVISRIFFILLVLFVIADTALGIINMQRLNDNKEPLWYFDSKTETVDGKTKTTYNLGLYVIIKEKGGKESSTSLRPFFLK